MAVYDLAHQRMCVRIVYDGAAGTGKTTNLRQLATAFATQRWGEVETPDEVSGRTLWFDWLQIRAGVVCGFPLICQVVTVPGQPALTPRRRELIASADVVVFVCESTREGVLRARPGLEVLEEVRRARSEPQALLLQANQQDRAGALAPAEVARLLGRATGEAFGAIARDGIGVVDTFIAAVRHLTRSIEGRARKDALRVPIAPVESARAVLRRLEATPIDAEAAAEMLLEEAAAILLGAETAAEVVQVPVGAAERGPGRALHAPWPTPDVPTGFVWPAHTGRQALADLGPLPPTPPAASAEGAIRVTQRGHVLWTHVGARYLDAESARQALVRAARERTQLESLLPVGTVLVMQNGSDGAFWLWTVAPRLSSVVERLLPPKEGDVGRAWPPTLSAAIAQAAVVAARRGVRIDGNLEGFGLQQEIVRWAGDLAPCEATPASAAIVLGAAVDGAARLGFEPTALAEELGVELSRRLSEEERDHWSAVLRGAEVDDPAVARVAASLRRAGQAA